VLENDENDDSDDRSRVDDVPLSRLGFDKPSRSLAVFPSIGQNGTANDDSIIVFYTITRATTTTLGNESI